MRKKTQKNLLEHVKSTYNKIADEFSQTRHYSWPEFIFFEDYVKKPGVKILDLGCGNGRFTKILPKGQKYLGIDISENLIEKAKKLHPEHEFKVGDILDLSGLEKEDFDVVISLAAFHHIPSTKSRIDALKNMHRVLKSDGTLILTVWNLWQPKYRKYIAKAFFRSILSAGNYHPYDTFIPWGKKKIPRYYHSFTPKEMEYLLKKAGFKLVEKHITKGKEKVKLHQGHNQIYICQK